MRRSSTGMRSTTSAGRRTMTWRAGAACRSSTPEPNAGRCGRRGDSRRCPRAIGPRLLRWRRTHGSRPRWRWARCSSFLRR
eukprot:969981-Prymnesium_polylepis.1